MEGQKLLDTAPGSVIVYDDHIRSHHSGHSQSGKKYFVVTRTAKKKGLLRGYACNAYMAHRIASGEASPEYDNMLAGFDVNLLRKMNARILK